ncbi:hypothetical protein M2909_04970 [Vagococcus lutrae]|nr:hypothetical protein [Vagococcus lutrae]UQF24343.1 hypothetical protein M2909_04970 [Vagococcus lutrae]UQF63566.1 hypothetical protein M2908_06745 [Vagococcus lutrae]
MSEKDTENPQQDKRHINRESTLEENKQLEQMKELFQKYRDIFISLKDK